MFRMTNVAVLCDEARESSEAGLSVHEELGLHREGACRHPEAGKLAFHTSLQDVPMLGILLYPVRHSATQNGLDGMLVDLCCKIKY